MTRTSQSFLGSPAEAQQAPQEEYLYVAAMRAGTGVDAPDFLAVVDTRPESDTYGRSSTRRRCPTSATSSTTSAGTAARPPATGPTART